MEREKSAAEPAEKPQEREVQGCIPYLFECLLGSWSPSGIALGVALGLMIGLIPKANLVALVLFVLMYLSGGNLLFGLASGSLGTLFSRWTGPLADTWGRSILSSPKGEAFFSRAFEYPLVPWTDLNNSVVLGQFLIGLLLFLPVFLFIWGICPRRSRSERDRTKSRE